MRMLRNMVLPLISLVSGIVCLYIDPRKDRGKAWIVIVVLSASALATGIYGYIDNRDNALQVAAAAKKADDQLNLAKSTQQEVDLLLLLLQRQGILTATSRSEISPAQVQRSFEADVARRQEMGVKVQNPSTQRSIIEYFTRDLDKAVVTKALQESGLEFRKTPARITDDPTNSIWVGNAVPLSDVKFVALTLLRAGVQLRAVRRFHDSSGPKAHLIEIGADRDMDNAPVLTVEQIQNMSELQS